MRRGAQGADTSQATCATSTFSAEQRTTGHCSIPSTWIRVSPVPVSPMLVFSRVVSSVLSFFFFVLAFQVLRSYFIVTWSYLLVYGSSLGSWSLYCVFAWEIELNCYFELVKIVEYHLNHLLYSVWQYKFSRKKNFFTFKENSVFFSFLKFWNFF